MAKKNQREITIIEALKRFDQNHHPLGETLPDSTCFYRVKVVTAMLKAGVPLSKFDRFRDLLEDHGYSLSSSTHLRQLVPFILHEEIASIKQEIAGKHLSIVFDGTTHVCKAMVIVLRYVTSDWQIKQKIGSLAGWKLGMLMLLANSMTGEEVAQQITTILSTEMGFPCHLVVAAMRDQACVSRVAMRTVSILYNEIMDIGFFSHTLDLVGNHMKTPILDNFVKSWVVLFSHNPKSRLLWKTQTGSSPASYTATRWWSTFEVIRQLINMFGDVPTFLSSDGLPRATSSTHLMILPSTIS